MSSPILQRPIYTLICGASFEQWVSANEEDLRTWFDLCGQATAEGPATFEDSFEDFCAWQYDCQLMQEEADGSCDEPDPMDDDTDPYEAIGESPFGLPGGGKIL